jgi:LytS/YehU family sensor histidine kinase
MVQKTSIHPLNNGQIFEDINFWIPFLGMLASIPFILAVEWFKQRSEIDSLEKEKSATELSLLKQQINPHFFFNTLNNLYALSIKKDEATPEVILQLSELMRYVIYKGKEESVKLEEEVKYIEDYVRLQQIRLHKKLDYQFDKTIDDPTLKVPPLLFILLVENAFKHGVEPAEEDCYLKIKLESNEKSLVFTCENSVEENEEEEAGIGLQNLKRRLELRFPNRHDLSITERVNSFLVELKLDLA